MNPLTVLQKAIKAIPALRYALGVAALGATVAIVKSFQLDWKVSVFGGLVVLVFMVALVVFAAIPKSKDRKLRKAASFLVWAFLILTVSSAYLFASSVFFRWPLKLFAVAEVDDPSKLTKEETAVDKLRIQVMELKGSWETLNEGNSTTLTKVYDNGKELAHRLKTIKAGLNFGHRIDRDEYAGYAFFMSADAAYRLKYPDAVSLLQEAIVSLRDSRATIDKVESLRTENPTDGYLQQVNRETIDALDADRISYLLSMCYALGANLGTHSKQEAVSELNKIANHRVKQLEVVPEKTPYLKDLLSEKK